MAKVTIEIEDLPGDKLAVRFVVDELATASTAHSNTAAQNAAIFLANKMREVGMNAPDLSGERVYCSQCQNHVVSSCGAGCTLGAAAPACAA